MKVSITSIELKGPLKFFPLSYRAIKVVRQLKASKYRAFRKKGIWTKHYTMTLWKNEEEMNDFYRSGAHLEAMKSSGEIAKEIRTVILDADQFPSWDEALYLLEKGKTIKYS